MSVFRSVNRDVPRDVLVQIGAKGGKPSLQKVASGRARCGCLRKHFWGKHHTCVLAMSHQSLKPKHSMGLPYIYLH